MLVDRLRRRRNGSSDELTHVVSPARLQLRAVLLPPLLLPPLLLLLLLLTLLQELLCRYNGGLPLLVFCGTP